MLLKTRAFNNEWDLDKIGSKSIILLHQINVMFFLKEPP